MMRQIAIAIGLLAMLGAVLIGCAKAPPAEQVPPVPQETAGDPVIDALDQTLEQPSEIDADPLGDLATLDEDLAALG